MQSNYQKTKGEYRLVSTNSGQNLKVIRVCSADD